MMTGCDVISKWCLGNVSEYVPDAPTAEESLQWISNECGV